MKGNEEVLGLGSEANGGILSIKSLTFDMRLSGTVMPLRAQSELGALLPTGRKMRHCREPGRMCGEGS